VERLLLGGTPVGDFMPDRSRACATLFAAASLAALACSTPGSDELDVPTEEAVAVRSPGAATEPDAPVRARGFTSAAFVHRVDSAITPWCSAVLVAPDVAVTAIGCVPIAGEAHLRVGVGSPGDAEMHDVKSVEILGADPRLAALVLEAPIEEVEPATLGGPATSRRCDAFGVAWLHVLDGDPSRRWLWNACVEPAPLGAIARVEDGESDGQFGNPNCHGDYGAGVFSAEGELLGVVVSVSDTEGCAVGFQLVSPRDGERDAFDDALELGQ
jgi:hypothetical protein